MEIRIEERPIRRAVLSGVISDDADFSQLRARFDDLVSIDLADVKRINSSGVRQWVQFVKTLPSPCGVTLVCCPVPFVSQAILIANFLGPLRVESFYVPLLCDDCGESQDALIQAGAVTTHLPVPSDPCPKCGGALTCDVDERSYLAFLGAP